MARKPRVDHIKIFQDKNKQYRASIVFSNAEIWATTEGYSTKAKCLSSADIISKGTGLPINIEAESRSI